MSDNKARCLCLVDTINSFIVLHASIFILNSSKKISSFHFGLTEIYRTMGINMLK